MPAPAAPETGPVRDRAEPKRPNELPGRRLFGSAFLLAVAASPPARAANADFESETHRVGRAERSAAPIDVDGRGDDAVWQSSPSHPLLTQREPVYGARAPLPTSFQVAYDQAALYVLVHAKTAPSGSVVRTLRRDDASIGDDDSITLKVDPNLDRRTSFNFTVNVAGAQQDTLVLDDGGVVLTQWDGVWEARVTEGRGEYTVEYRIPFAILGIQDRAVQDLGLNLVRVSVQPSATAEWNLSDPPHNSNSASTFGRIEGVSGVTSTRTLELIPYVAARTNFEPGFRIDPRADPTLRAGFDARLQTAPGAYAELSVLTDFSQENIDSVQVASDRFPLFFDEQRAFFINGLSELRFGQFKVRQLVDTRRIGLVGQTQVPILTGLKAYGQSERFAYALLNVETLDGRAAGAAHAPAENFSVARVRFAPARRLWLGGIVAAKHRWSEANNDHYSLGLDGEVKSADGKTSWYTFWAGTHTEHPLTPELRDAGGAITTPLQPAFTNRGEAAYTRLRYSGQLFRPYVDYAYSTPDFDPALGYYSRTGVAEHYATPKLVPRINRYGLQEFSFAPIGSFATDPSYQHLLRNSLALEGNLVLETGQSVLYRVERRWDHVDQPFALFGFQVAARDYTAVFHTVNITTPIRRWMDGFFKYTYSTAFDGYRHEFGQSVRLRASQHFMLNVGYEHWMGRLDDAREHFSFGFGNGSAVLALNPNLSLDAVGRFNLQPGREQLGVQGRLRYRYRPGSDLYVVYRASESLNGSSTPNSQELSLKLNCYSLWGL